MPSTGRINTNKIRQSLSSSNLHSIGEIVCRCEGNIYKANKNTTGHSATSIFLGPMEMALGSVP